METDQVGPRPLRGVLAATALPLVWMTLTVTPAGGQQSDTTRVTPFDRTVVAAERSESTIGEATSSVSRVTGQELARLPAVNLSEVLRLVPGFSVLHVDGLGHDPQIVSRGFFGGGGTDYVKLLWNGRPLNGLESNGIVWDLLPPAAISAIEVVRGPGSALYGDGALGGVINVISPEDAPRNGFWELAAGSPLSLGGSVRGQGDLAFLPSTFFAGFRRIDGFRENATRTVGNAGATIDLTPRSDRDITASALVTWQDYESPGPRPASEIETDPEPIEIFYSYDGAFTYFGRADVEGVFDLSDASHVTARIGAELRRRTEIETIQPAVDNGDTEERTVDTDRFLATVQYENEGFGTESGRLALGADVSAGRIGVEHLDVVSGGAVVYVFTEPDRPVIATRDGSRNTAGFFGRYDFRPTDALRVSFGGRFDWLGDSAEPGQPDPGPSVSADHTAFSPSVGLNLRWLDSGSHTGNVYFNAGRTFKAPTPDQLYDQRDVPLPTAAEVEISNPLLEPEVGTNLEVGLYHDVSTSGPWSASFSAAVYQIDMEDEIQLDLSTSGYENIGESRRRGVEGGADVQGPSGSRIFVNYTFQDATSEVGATAGNRLRLVPRHTWSAGASTRPHRYVDVGLYVTHHTDSWLDDENTTSLSGFTRVDARASIVLDRLEISLKARNLLDESYSTAGLLIPGASPTALLFPAAGPVLEAGIRIEG